jgi:hypothetical protein
MSFPPRPIIVHNKTLLRYKISPHPRLLFSVSLPRPPFPLHGWTLNSPRSSISRRIAGQCVYFKLLASAYFFMNILNGLHCEKIKCFCINRDLLRNKGRDRGRISPAPCPPSRRADVQEDGRGGGDWAGGEADCSSLEHSAAMHIRRIDLSCGEDALLLRCSSVGWVHHPTRRHKKVVGWRCLIAPARPRGS